MSAAMRAPRRPDYSMGSFSVIDSIGEGSYGEVLHVKRLVDGAAASASYMRIA